MSRLPAITYENALTLLRNVLVDYSGILSDLIINADSIYGPDVMKEIESLLQDCYEQESPTVTDTFIVFEYKENEGDHYAATSFSQNNVSTTMETIGTYSMYLKIYGDNCHNSAQKILSIFKTPTIAENLRNSGVYINGISPITPGTEFINLVRWQRCDLEIKTICRFVNSIPVTSPQVEAISNVYINGESAD